MECVWISLSWWNSENLENAAIGTVSILIDIRVLHRNIAAVLGGLADLMLVTHGNQLVWRCQIEVCAIQSEDGTIEYIDTIVGYINEMRYLLYNRNLKNKEAEAS